MYHLSIKIISRGKGKSAVAAAAYRAGEIIKNEYDGITHDYTRKRGIIYKDVLLPFDAPREYADRAVLWNAVEKIENAKNSQLAREIEISLPAELSATANLMLAKNFVLQHFVKQGMCADVCIHDKGDGNPHAHILLTMRPFEIDGSWGAKSKKEYILDDKGERIRLASGEYKSRKIPAVDWNEQTNADIWRKAWEESLNTAYEYHGIDERVDHRSYERQGIEQIPTIHLGAAASQMERRGIRTERGNINREIEAANKEIRQLKARIAKLQIWLKEEMQNAEPPTLADVISNILSRKQGYYKTTDGLKAAATILNFLTANGIMDMAGLDDKFKSMIHKQVVISDSIKKVNRRLNTLDEHLKQSENYNANRKYKTQYDKLYAEYETLNKSSGLFAKSKAQKALDAANAYSKTHEVKLQEYKIAEGYLKGVLQGHFDPKKSPPITKWKAEREKIMAEKNQINRELSALKTDINAVTRIRSSVYDIMAEERRQPQRSHDRGL